MAYYKGLSLDGKRALVFGGTSGLGKSIALGFAEAGADVVPVSRRAEEVQKTAGEIRALGRRTIELTADVTHREDIQRVIDRMRAEMGRIDILVNSAGTTKRAPSLEFADEDWNRVLNINLNGTWYACQMVGRVMKEQAYGRIINIASIGAFLSLYEVTAYCASKGAVAMMTRCLGAEWVKYNITVNALAPGVFETPLNRNVVHEPGRKASIMAHTPMKRFGNLEEIKGVAIFLASDSASFVTGEVIAVDGGFMAQGIGS
ncbi:MAG: 2-deoxy-D-gluconate 3-dehydrogenase [Acidobacteria bacterium]|nr:MAG: 2-deoxy-D-gluconate 3-dehydrogenase [Acidobacteriota bacterium]